MTAADRAALLPPGMTPRLLTREQAAAYCGISPSQFSDTIAKEVEPVRFRRDGKTVRWDRVAIDVCIDKKSGLYNGGERQRSIAERLNGDPGARR
jgi:hypothetical protein